MPRFPDKWLSIFLALLLGVIPFGQALADITASGSHPIAGSKPMSEHRQMSHIVNDGKTCKHCSQGHSCDLNDCACYQCGSCSATLPHELLSLHFATLAAQYPSSAISLITYPPIPPFRPPRS